MIVIDLPSLECIKLGYRAVEGKFNDTICSLVMRSMNQRVRYD